MRVGVDNIEDVVGCVTNIDSNICKKNLPTVWELVKIRVYIFLLSTYVTFNDIEIRILFEKNVVGYFTSSTSFFLGYLY